MPERMAPKVSSAVDTAARTTTISGCNQSKPVGQGENVLCLDIGAENDDVDSPAKVPGLDVGRRPVSNGRIQNLELDDPFPGHEARRRSNSAEAVMARKRLT